MSQIPFAAVVGDIAVWLGNANGPILCHQLFLPLFKLLIKATHWYVAESVILMSFIPIDLAQLQLGLCLQLLGMDEMAQNGSDLMALTMR